MVWLDLFLTVIASVVLCSLGIYYVIRYRTRGLLAGAGVAVNGLGFIVRSIDSQSVMGLVLIACGAAIWILGPVLLSLSRSKS